MSLRKLTANDRHEEIFSFKKNICIYYFFRKKTSNTISKLSDHFFEDFFEVLHISVSPKINILESRSTLLFQQKHMVVSKIVKF